MLIVDFEGTPGQTMAFLTSWPWFRTGANSGPLTLERFSNEGSEDHAGGRVVLIIGPKFHSRKTSSRADFRSISAWDRCLQTLTCRVLIAYRLAGWLAYKQHIQTCAEPNAKLRALNLIVTDILNYNRYNITASLSVASDVSSGTPGAPPAAALPASALPSAAPGSCRQCETAAPGASDSHGRRRPTAPPKRQKTNTTMNLSQTRSLLAGAKRETT